MFLNWFAQLVRHGRIDEADYKKLERVYHNPKEVNMLINAIKKERKQLRNEGIAIGMEKGMEKGKVLQRMEFAKLMLERGEPLEKIKGYTGLSIEAIKKIRKELGERKN